MNLENCKKISLNSPVILKLTEEGLSTLCFHHTLESTKEYFGDNLDLETREVRMPLADVINIYGEGPFMEGFDPFVDAYIYIPEDSLE